MWFRDNVNPDCWVFLPFAVWTWEQEGHFCNKCYMAKEKLYFELTESWKCKCGFITKYIFRKENELIKNKMSLKKLSFFFLIFLGNVLTSHSTKITSISVYPYHSISAVTLLKNYLNRFLYWCDPTRIGHARNNKLFRTWKSKTSKSLD